MKHTISVVVSAYNEEEKLSQCLSSVSFADEIIVVDNNSSDKTSMIAKKYTSRVFKRPNNLMLNVNKNYGFSKATSDWILNLDADEVVTPELATEIRSILEIPIEEAKYGYWINRKNIIFGKWIQYGIWWPDKQLRLFQRKHGVFPEKHIHEYIDVGGDTEELEHPYLHYNYDSVSQYLTKLARCTTSEALALKESKYHFFWYDAIRFPLSDFLKIFFAQGGWRDGLHGLVLSFFQAFYSFVVFAKLWEMKGFKEEKMDILSLSKEFVRGKKEFEYWMRESRMKETSSGVEKTFLHIRQKISL